MNGSVIAVRWGILADGIIQVLIQYSETAALAYSDPYWMIQGSRLLLPGQSEAAIFPCCLWSNPELVLWFLAQ